MTCFGCLDTGKDRFGPWPCPVCSAPLSRFQQVGRRRIDDLYDRAGEVGANLHLAATSTGRAREEYFGAALSCAHRSYHAAMILLDGCVGTLGHIEVVSKPHE